MPTGSAKTRRISVTKLQAISTKGSQPWRPLFMRKNIDVLLLSASILLLCYSLITKILNHRTNALPLSLHLQSETETLTIVEDLERWKDRTFAQSHLRIYVYDIPSRFNQDLIDRSVSRPGPIADARCDRNFYSSEYHIHQYFLKSPARTLKPEEADFFYVPVYTTCDLILFPPNRPSRTGKNFADAVALIRRDFPYYNQTDGRNHVYTFSQGFAARLAGEWQKFSNGIFMVHNGEFTAAEYSPHKDFVVPPELRFYLKPYWADEERVKKPFKPRYLGHYGGQIISINTRDHRGSNYSGGVRQYLRTKYARHTDYRITGPRISTYTDDMMKSKFCFAPEGWHPWSPRPYYGVLMGCIPVIISEKQELGFEEFIDWDKFAVWVRPSDIKQIDSILRSFSDEDIARRRQEMQKIWRVFWYGEGGLGHEAILKSLYSRKYQSRPSRMFSTGVEAK